MRLPSSSCLSTAWHQRLQIRYQHAWDPGGVVLRGSDSPERCAQHLAVARPVGVAQARAHKRAKAVVAAAAVNETQAQSGAACGGV